MTYLLRDIRQMLGHIPIASRMIQQWKTPGIPKRDKMTLPREPLNANDLQRLDRLHGLLTAIQPLPQMLRQDARPKQDAALVPSSLEIRHDTVHHVRQGGEDINSVHVLLLAFGLEDLDVGDVLVEDVVFLEDVVEETFGLLVDDEDFPFAAGGGPQLGEDYIALCLDYREGHVGEEGRVVGRGRGSVECAVALGRKFETL